MFDWLRNHRKTAVALGTAAGVGLADLGYNLPSWVSTAFAWLLDGGAM